ncbi:hypothetical protein LGH82_03325 [Mesorhizobium sp. PAMC28654]|uniref:hypothetical protein n=1 Tax=Mesorhizobium sp. PAMC28654 TaxID=2880934 RepID=UPI001D0B3D85|nr:hypothetical protein [Mesorhizobium sp. PAMC28654]UDL90416.1 hypothetical protein LGH82_03325 [Mesorhizobium sp. PAMC28654]
MKSTTICLRFGDSRHGQYIDDVLFLGWRRAMIEPKKNEKRAIKQFESGIDQDNSLLPMLIGGLVLIVVGAIVVMMFV